MRVPTDPTGATDFGSPLAGIPWDQEPNRAPCSSWRTCGRNYELIEYEAGSGPWKLLGRTFAFEVSAEGVRWSAAGSRAFTEDRNE